MSGTGRRRVWTEAVAVPADGGFEIRLDRAVLKLPGGAVLRIGGRALADAVALEWAAAGSGPGGIVVADALPLTRLAGTCQERVAPARQRTIETLAGHIEGELLAYRASHPRSLADIQAAQWQPWLDWCESHLGARFAVTRGVMPVRQNAAVHVALRRALAAQDDPSLTALGVMVPALGSLVLGLAVVEDALGANEAGRLAAIDETDQQERWGTDREAEERQAALLRDVSEAARFLALSRNRATLKVPAW